MRIVLGDLRVGVSSGLLRDAIVDTCFKPEDISGKKEKVGLGQDAYDKSSDFA